MQIKDNDRKKVPNELELPFFCFLLFEFLIYFSSLTLWDQLDPLEINALTQTHKNTHLHTHTHKNAHTHSPSVLYIYIYKYIYISDFWEGAGRIIKHPLGDLKKVRTGHKPRL